MKKRNILIIMLIVVIIVSIVFIKYFIDDNNGNNFINKNTLCNKINKSKEKNSNFIIIINNKYKTNADIEDALDNFRKEYDKELIYDISFDEINNECMKKSLEDTGMYNLLLENKIPTVIGYSNGKYTGVIQNEGDYNVIKKFFEEKGVIKKHEIEETITYNMYLENIEKNEKYLILLITNEKIRKELSLNMKKVFPDVKQNTVNIESEVGKKILVDLKEKAKIKEIYPQVFYFENKKVIANDGVFSVKMFEEFKNTIDKK